MFFHGIRCEFLEKQFPVLSSRRSLSEKTEEQKADRKHLLDRFGIEPVHLLEADDQSYSVRRCIRECSKFGNVVLAFDTLPLPLWQLSRHEVGVPALDVRECCWLAAEGNETAVRVKRLFPRKRIVHIPVTAYSN